MKREKRQEAKVLRAIMQQAAEEAEIQIDAKTYHTFILNSGSAPIRMIVSENGLTFCPVDRDVESCIIE